ncbi:MAG: MACPF domain-containing protein, partial [Bacteroides sp.]|nr:MACPF domain-containing protein [Bacteroides sp.]
IDSEELSPARLIEKYGTHVVTNILLGGVCSFYFYARGIWNEREFNDNIVNYQNELIRKENTWEVFKDYETFEDIKVHIRCVGGSVPIAIQVAENEFKISYKAWEESVSRETDQIISIGSHTASIYPISEFIVNTDKKREVRNTLIEYCK